MIVIDMSIWGWPQWTVIVLSALGLLIHGVSHGQPRPSYHIGYSVVDTLILFVMLAFGGFFS